LLLLLLLHLPEKSYEKHLAVTSLSLLRRLWGKKGPPLRMDILPVGPNIAALPVLHGHSPFACSIIGKWEVFFLRLSWGSKISAPMNGRAP
jgi:hypothetical protein